MRRSGTQNKNKKATIKSSAKKIDGGSIPQRKEIIPRSLIINLMRTQRERNWQS